MKGVSRYEKYKDESLDYILLQIKTGKIKVGKYSHLVKVSNKPIKGKELFKNDDSKGE